MRVRLVIPPSVFLLDERVFMSLGVLRVAAALESAGVEVDVLDLSGVRDYEGAVAEAAGDGWATHWGITATTPQMPAATRIRRVLGERRVILGGPHVTLVHSASRAGSARGARALEELRGFGTLVAGDGERAIFRALADDAPGLVDADDPSSDLFLRPEDLDAAPLPARHLVDVPSYRYSLDGRRALSLIAQLGCPFGCGFCGGRTSPSFRRVRTRSPRAVAAEVAHLHRAYGVDAFMFQDDELNVSPRARELMLELSALQERLGVSMTFRGFVKAQLLTPELADAMVAAGFRWVLVGFESGDDRILANIQKRATRADNTRCVAVARAAGLKVKALTSIGHPGESAATVRATMDWLLEVRPEDFDATIITTYPGTPYYDEAVQTAPGVWTYTARGGDRLHSEDVDYGRVADYYKGVPGSYRSHVHTDHLSASDLVALRDDLEDGVRAHLSLPYPVGPAAAYDHSMGQGQEVSA